MVLLHVFETAPVSRVQAPDVHVRIPRCMAHTSCPNGESFPMHWRQSHLSHHTDTVATVPQSHSHWNNDITSVSIAIAAIATMSIGPVVIRVQDICLAGIGGGVHDETKRLASEQTPKTLRVSLFFTRLWDLR